MQNEQVEADNGRTGRSLERGPRAGAIQTEGESGLGDVVQDAIEHIKVIVSDSVSIGKLEARRIAQRAEDTGRELVPRVAVGAMAVVVGLAGVVLALIALFIALEDVIPSVAVRLVIFAAAFLLMAAAGAFYALRSRNEGGEKALAPAAPPARIVTRPVSEAEDGPAHASQISR